MAKQLNIDLNLRANTTQAKQSLQQLQSDLTKIANMPAFDVATQKLNTGLVQASQAAKELQYHLTTATNTKTGNLDMSKFSMSLKKANADLGQLSGKLLQAGTSGQSAFTSLATSIANADRHAITLGSRLGGLLTTLKNTARWQLSSMMLHGFINSVREAYNYAQDLNKSLNNIRIVTGLSTDKMAEFAEQANKAAKALSTSTLKYTDAALIYYQQGIRDQQEIAERTTATIKLANVTRQSAEEVSSQLTAIWNNFDNGSKSLEYYADAITALGAATASSSAEIAEGLQKFSAVADTVGLSYEKATAALATVVAQTRQSADIVGTAFKTIFARIEGLKVGDTLEDGVTLNQYSATLKKIGVNILDNNNQLKDMDTILDSIGAKWDTLSQATKVATAQQVAGLRQYQQFIALMDNYDKVLSNQELAEDSEGTLQKQQDIYAQSWEAASKRVKASLESVYNDLLDDEFFIKFTDGFAQIISGIGQFIKGMGGIKPLLIGLGGFFLSSISGKILPAIQSLKLNLITMFQSPKQQAQEYRDVMEQVMATAKADLGVNFEKADLSTQAALKGAQNLSVARNRLLELDKQLTPEEQRLYDQELAFVTVQQQEAQALADKATATQKSLEAILDENSNEKILSETEKNRAEGLQKLINEYWELQEISTLAETPKDAANMNQLIEAKRVDMENWQNETDIMIGTQNDFIDALLRGYEAAAKQAEGLQLTDEEMQHLNNGAVVVKDVFKDFGGELAEIQAEFKSSDMGSESMEKAKGKIIALHQKFKELRINVPQLEKLFNKCFSTSSPDQLKRHIGSLKTALKQLGIPADEVKRILREMGKGETLSQVESKVKLLSKDTKNYTKAQEAANAALKNFNPQHMMSGVEAFSKMASVGMQAAMVINSVKSAINALTSEDMSPLEKFSTILMSVGMIVPAVIGGLKSLSAVSLALQASILGNNIALEVESALFGTAETKAAGLMMIKRLQNSETAEETALNLASLAVKKGLIAEDDKEAAKEAILQLVKSKGNKLKLKDIAATLTHIGIKGLDTAATEGETVAEEGKNVAKTKGIALTYASMPPMLLLLAIIIAVVAIVWALVKAVQALAAWYNKDAIAAERAAESAENLKQVYEDTKQAYEDLKASIEDYHNAVDAIKELTKGTLEFQEAVQKANEEALELINNSNKITSSDYSINSETGLIEFKDGVLEKLQAEKFADVQRTLSISQQAQINAQQAQAQSDWTNLSRSQMPSFWQGFIPIIGSLMLLGNSFRGLYQQDAINSSVIKLTTGSLAAAYRNNQLSDEELMDKLDIDDEDLLASIKELADAINKNTEQQEATANQIADQNLRDEHGNLLYDQATVEFASEAYEEANKRIYDEVIKTSHDYVQADNKSDLESNSNSIWHRYLRAIGQDQGDYRLIANAIQGNDNNREYHFRVGTGDEQSITEEQMATAIAAAEAIEALGEAAKEAQKTLNNLSDEDFEGYSKEDFSSIIATHGTTSLTKAETEAFEAEFNGDTSNKRDWVKYLVGKGYDEDIAKSVADDLATNFHKIDWASIGEDLPESAKTVFHKFYDNIVDSLTGEEAQALEDLTRDTYAQLGLSGVQALSDIFKDYTVEDQVQIAKIASTYNWVSGSTNGFIQALEAAGVTTQDNIDILTEYADQMIKVNAGLKDATSEFKTLEKAVKDLKSNGYVDKDTFDTLFKDNWSEYFTLMADGTYKLIGDAQQFYNLVHQKEQQNFVDKLNYQRERLDQLEIRSGIDINSLKGSERNVTHYTTHDALSKGDAIQNFMDYYTWGKTSKDIRENGIPIENFFTGLGTTLTQNTYQNTSIYKTFEEQWKKAIAEANKDNPLFSSNLIPAPTEKDFVNWLKKDNNYKGIDYSLRFEDKDHTRANKDVIDQQLLLLSTLENQTEETRYFLEHAADDAFWNDPTNTTKLQEIIDSLTDEDIEQAIKDIETEILGTQKQLASTAETLTELNFLVQQYDLGIEAQAEGLLTLANNYENAADEAAKFAAAINSSNEEAKEAEEANLRLAIRVGELAEQYDLTVDVLETQAKLIQADTKYSMLSAEQAANLAAKNQRLNRGIETLHDNWEDWSTVLKSSNKLSMDYADTLSQANEALADLTGAVDAAHIPTSFLSDDAKGAAEHIELLGKAAKGDANAIQELGLELAKASFEEMKLLDTATKITETDFEEAQNKVTQGIEDFQTALANGLNNKSLRETFSDDWIESLNTMAEATQMSVEEMNGYLNELGVSIPVKLVYKDFQKQVPVYSTKNYTSFGWDDKGFYTKQDSHTWISDYENVTEKIGVAAIGKNSKVTFVGATGGGGVSSSSISDDSTSSSSSSSSPTKSVKAVDKSEIDVYKPIQDQLDTLTDAYDKASTAKDRLYGTDYVKNLRQEINLVSQLAKTQEQYTKTAEQEYKKGQTKAANGEKADAARGLGISYTSKDSAGNQTLNWTDAKSLKELIGFDLQYDDQGNIINYNQAQEALEQGKRNLASYFNGLTAAEQEAMTDSGWYDMWLSQYEFQLDNLEDIDESHKEILESQQQEIEYQNQLQDLHYEDYQASVERRKKINQLEQDNLDHMLKRLGDDAYKTAEGRSYLLNSANIDMNGVLDSQRSQMDLEARFKNNEISEAQYYEGTEANLEDVTSWLDNIYDKRDENREYYETAIGNLNSEIQIYTDLLAGNTSLLDHVKNTISLMNKDNNFEAMGKILEAQKRDAERNLEISKQLYDVKRKEADSAFATYEKLKGTGTEAEKTAKEAWETAEKEAKDAENSMYENAEQVINATNALIENQLNKVKKAREYLFTDGMGWDYINKSMELSEKYADKYLTKTNQIYETNKLLRNLQNDIDKTTNAAAKQKLANFAQEIQRLQNTKELSKGQLEIAQAQYDLLKAQIELEEAQNAKSVVRLQRDAEGNYGYVYTADQNNVAAAQQKVEDQENNLYNKNLELERSSLQELSELQQSFQSEMSELERQYYIDRSITQEQFETQRAMLEEKYNNLIVGTTKDYLISKEGLRQTSITGENDDWTKEYEDLGSKLSGYIDQADSFWTGSYGALTGKRENWFTTENTEWTNFYTGISTIASATKTTIETIADELKNKMVGEDGESGVIGDLQNKINDTTGLGKDFRDVGISADVFGDKLTGTEGGGTGLVGNLTTLGLATDGVSIKFVGTDKAGGLNKDFQTLGASAVDLGDNDLSGLETKLGDVDTSSETLEDTLTNKDNGLIKAYGDTAEAVRNSVQDFSDWYDEVDDDIKKAEAFRKKLIELLEKANEDADAEYWIYWKEDPDSGYPPELDDDEAWYTIHYVSDYSGFEGNPSGNGENPKGGPGEEPVTDSRYTYVFTLNDSKTRTFYSGTDAFDYYNKFNNKVKKLMITNNDTNHTYEPTDDYWTYLQYMSQVGYDTGGYTGKWNSPSQNPIESGKWALLHQKELVLNQEDTKNMLASIQILRQITDAIDLRAAATNLATGLSSPSYLGQAQSLQQDVQIRAEFPNVQDHNEIQEAFNNLVNQAAQYAARDTYKY